MDIVASTIGLQAIYSMLQNNNTGVPEELLIAAVKEYFSLAEMNDKLHYELPGKVSSRTSIDDSDLMC